ncbi:bifunctional riboflavin kinase/FAD synthetase [Sulfurimonas autotrophica]|uniref:Riboflavin biosynthesis protein n=1 Tax=Sulfurimonas autotrophica (strain ATCC BAA-671 / DSM 16294 / JCM 11897 / OK10) TaxID=563040 RepID=E0URJ1_SULAO|nr:bifunctional riboflavin kinase/FAD synthetase [Sulfurimonas autotrophica]ADN08935.1 riboflavin biosynthesis protein RibF [Sulfurimonas autotrophica DSM 16294]
MNKTTTISIGGFDGMHIGHQALFDKLDDKGTIVVIETGYANLTPDRFRERYTTHRIVYLKLDDIRHLDAKGFVNLLKVKFPKLKKIVVGYDFHFGKDRKYSYDDLKNIFKGEVVVVEEVKHNNDSVHSHKIRAKLQIGDIKGANEFLGHNYMVVGKRIDGQGLGSKELFATINLDVKDFLLPKEGVYATLTRIDDEEHYHPSVSFIGHRVSTDGTFAVESHILDGELTCKDKAEISFVDFIRNNEKFDSIQELKEAIKKDIAKAGKELKFLQL